MPVGAPTERQFRRAQVKPTRRRGWRRLLGWRALRAVAGVALLVYCGYQGVALLTSTAGLHVSQIVVRGNQRLSTGEVLAMVSDLRGQSILTANLGAYRTRLTRSPWVADASLRRLLPSTVEVTVVERVPMGLGRIGAALYLVDQGGVAIDEYGPQYAEFDLPIIDGLSPGGVGAMDPPRVALAAQVMRALRARPDLVRKVSQIDVSDPRDAVVLLDGDTARLHLGDDRFVDRLQSYVELAPTLRGRVPDIDYVDLRFGERVYVRPAGTPEKRPVAPRRP